MKSNYYCRKHKTIVKKCHLCGHVMESHSEIKKCSKCKKSFLPSNYHTKITAKTTQEFYDQYLEVDELAEEILVKGIQVIW